MKKTNINIVVTAAPIEKIKASFPKNLILTDADIFNMMNSGIMIGDQEMSFHQDKIIDLLESTLLNSTFDNITIHSFNPMVLNALENTDDDHPSINKTFLIYSEKVGFRNVFEHKSIDKKCSVLSIGDAIVDTYMADIILDFENGKNMTD